MASIALRTDFRVNLLHEFELWLLNTLIDLLSRSKLVRCCVKDGFSMLSDKPLVLWVALIVASGLAGILSGYAYAQVIFR